MIKFLFGLTIVGIFSWSAWAQPRNSFVELAHLYFDDESGIAALEVVQDMIQPRGFLKENVETLLSEARQAPDPVAAAAKLLAVTKEMRELDKYRKTRRIAIVVPMVAAGAFVTEMYGEYELGGGVFEPLGLLVQGAIYLLEGSLGGGAAGLVLDWFLAHLIGDAQIQATIIKDIDTACENLLLQWI